MAIGIRTPKKKDNSASGSGAKGKDSFKADILKLLDELEKENDWTFEKELARQIAIVEYYYGIIIDMHYPLMKKLNQLEHLNYCFWLDMKKAGVTEEDWKE